MTQDHRERALQLVEEGIVSADHLLLCCLKAMSEDDVEWTLDANELSDRFLNDDDDDDDDIELTDISVNEGIHIRN